MHLVYLSSEKGSPSLCVIFASLRGQIKSHRLMDLAPVLAQIYKPISCLTLLSQPEETKPSDHFLRAHTQSQRSSYTSPKICLLELSTFVKGYIY